MNNDPLANLKPLIEPAPIPWWPPAPGWWLLAALCFLVLVLLIVYTWRRWQHQRNTAYQREAAQLITLINTMPPQQQLPLLAEILRRSAIYVWGREQVGSIHWDALIERAEKEYATQHRNKKAPTSFDENSLQLLSHHLYSGATPSHDDMQNMVDQANIWLKTLPAVRQKNGR